MKKIIHTRFAKLNYQNDSLIIITLKKIDPSLIQVDEFIEALESVFNEFTSPYIIILDSSESKWINSAARIALGKHSRQNELLQKDNWLKTYIIVKNTSFKIVLKSFNLVSKPVIPQIICKTMEAAMKATQEDFLKLNKFKSRLSL